MGLSFLLSDQLLWITGNQIIILRSDEQVKIMSIGGNKRFAEFLDKYDIPHEPRKDKFHTKAASYYREMVHAS